MFYIYADDQLIYQPLESKLALFSPKVTLEIGKAGSLEFGIPSSNDFYNKLSQLVTDVRVELDNEEIFFGRVLSSKKAFNNVKTIYCEGDLAYLVDSVQKCEAYEGKANALFTKIVTAHNNRVEEKKRFQVDSSVLNWLAEKDVILTGQKDDINVGEIDYKQIAINSIVDEWNNTYDFIKTTLIDYCGGYLRTRHENGVVYLDYVQEYFNNASQTIELGSNLLDLNDELKVDELFTVLIPLGDDNLTIKSVNNGSEEWVDENLVAQYGRIVKTHVFSNVNDPNTLKENARRFMESNAKSTRTVEITAVDLHLIDPSIEAIHLGDRVHIVSSPHEMDEYLTCTKIEYDLTNPGNNKYTFGNPKQTLTERYREDARKQSDRYGNSEATGASSPARAAIGSAAAAGKAAGEEGKEAAEEEITNFYDAWIKADQYEGTVSLGALYKSLSKAGIDISADPDGAEIHTIVTHDWIDMNLGDVGTVKAKVDQIADDHGAKWESILEFIGEDGITKRVNSIDQTLSDGENSITARVGELENGKMKEAGVQLWIDTIKSEAGNVADQKISNIKLTADNITLSANDNTTISSKLTTIASDVTTISGRLEAADAIFSTFQTQSGKATAMIINKVGAQTISVSNADDSPGILMLGPNDIMNHYHTLNESTKIPGRVELGKVTFVGPTFFNIADTNFYKAGVSARTAKTANYAIDPDTGELSYSLIEVHSDDNYVTAPINLGFDAYELGKSTVTIARKSDGSNWITYDLDPDHHTDYTKMNVKLTNDNTFIINTKTVYDAGARSVQLIDFNTPLQQTYSSSVVDYSVDITNNDHYVVYSNKDQTVKARILVSITGNQNQNQIKKYIHVSIPAGAAYTKGKTDGAPQLEGPLEISDYAVHDVTNYKKAKCTVPVNTFKTLDKADLITRKREGTDPDPYVYETHEANYYNGYIQSKFKVTLDNGEYRLIEHRVPTSLVPLPSAKKPDEITSNGVDIDVRGYGYVTVNVPIPAQRYATKLNFKSWSENGQAHIDYTKVKVTYDKGEPTEDLDLPLIGTKTLYQFAYDEGKGDAGSSNVNFEKPSVLTYYGSSDEYDEMVTIGLADQQYYDRGSYIFGLIEAKLSDGKTQKIMVKMHGEYIYKDAIGDNNYQYPTGGTGGGGTGTTTPTITSSAIWPPEIYSGTTYLIPGKVNGVTACELYVYADADGYIYVSEKRSNMNGYNAQLSKSYNGPRGNREYYVVTLTVNGTPAQSITIYGVKSTYEIKY